MIDNACFSQPRYDSRTMLIKSIYSIGFVGSIELSLSSITSLVTEKILLAGCLSLIASLHLSTCYLVVPLPRSNFEKSLTRMVFCPDLVAGV
jgi:hypothetical protein